MLKSKAYLAINIIGLATGMAVAILIALWIWDELSFNNYRKNHQTIAQVMTTQTFNEETGTGQAVPLPLGTELRNKYVSDFKAVSMSSWNFGHIIGVGYGSHADHINYGQLSGNQSCADEPGKQSAFRVNLGESFE